MTASNGNPAVPNKMTGLLTKNAARASDTSLSANESSYGSIVADGDTDVESGTADTSSDGEEEGNEENPALKRTTDTKMGLLVPAVAIGVSFSSTWSDWDRLRREADLEYPRFYFRQQIRRWS